MSGEGDKVYRVRWLVWSILSAELDKPNRLNEPDRRDFLVHMSVFGSCAIDLFTISNLYHQDDQFLILNRIDDAIVSFANAV
jgi:hypothetical protein